MRDLFTRLSAVIAAIFIITLGGTAVSATAAGIDYTIPAYAGEKINYGANSFCRVTQYVLDGDIVKNQKIPYTAFNDRSTNRDNSYTKLVNTNIGISKMPLFAITKTTGDTSSSNISLCYFHPDKDDEGSSGADVIMQYIKMPEDLENPQVQLMFNFADNDNIAKNVAPYSGLIYYMERGEDRWVETQIRGYWFTLPTGFEGYIKIESEYLRALGPFEYSKSWRIYNYLMNVANLTRQTVTVSAPFKVEGSGNIQNAAYIGSETKAARNIFTGTVLTLKDVTDHTCKHSSWETVVKATCVSKGSEKSVCTICAKLQTRTTDKVAHDYSGPRVIKAPTCAETGVSESECSVCGKTERSVLDKIDHVTEKFKIIEEATCTKDGLVCEKCKVCNAEFNEKVVKKEHDYGEGTVIKAATETEDGVSVKTCAECGATAEEVIPKTGQVPAENNSENTNGTVKKSDNTALIIGIIIGITATVLMGAVIIAIILLRKKP